MTAKIRKARTTCFSKGIVLRHRSSLREFEPILKAWIRVLVSYSRRNPVKDLPWWYRERPQVGLLAAAAWRAGGGALEEWKTEKGTRLQRSYGRNDLWIFRGKRQWFIEAKHAWCDILPNGVSQTSVKKMQSELNAAKSAARKLNQDCHQRVAALFVSPIWKPKRSGPRRFDWAVSRWKAACRKLQPDACAFLWHSPDEKNGDKRVLFGCSLLLTSAD